jgi:hypothetical protein
MRSKNLMAVMLVGLAAMMLYMAFSPSPRSEDEEAVRARGRQEEPVVDEHGRPAHRVSIEWASWRTEEIRTEEPEPVEPAESRDPRLEDLLDDLQNVDVYIQGDRDGR